VVHKLATAWSTLPALAKLVRADSAFGAFVTEHINASTDQDEVRALVRLATTRCPLGSRVLCSRIRDAAQEAVNAQPNQRLQRPGAGGSMVAWLES
jgi:hypothetical protein